ncbi:MAG: hypothetical protein JRH18_19935 [Deltaproteobacteria bacterium]|nr:hypothetical protein [Deltaproteobacteria bacterium]MBW2153922.1 hypothetical protein [Deltaproteobacteria bacterium]
MSRKKPTLIPWGNLLDEGFLPADIIDAIDEGLTVYSIYGGFCRCPKRFSLLWKAMPKAKINAMDFETIDRRSWEFFQKPISDSDSRELAAYLNKYAAFDRYELLSRGVFPQRHNQKEAAKTLTNVQIQKESELTDKTVTHDAEAAYDVYFRLLKEKRLSIDAWAEEVKKLNLNHIKEQDIRRMRQIHYDGKNLKERIVSNLVKIAQKK